MLSFYHLYIELSHYYGAFFSDSFLDFTAHFYLSRGPRSRRLREVERSRKLREVERSQRLREVGGWEKLREVRGWEKLREVERSRRLREVGSWEKLREVRGWEKLREVRGWEKLRQKNYILIWSYEYYIIYKVITSYYFFVYHIHFR